MAVHITRAGVALTVGIIVLTGLIIGGLFWARGVGEQARREEAVAIAEQNLQADSNKEIVLNDGATDETNDAPTGTDSGEQETTAPTNDSAGTEQPVADELPQTGPVDTLASIVVIALLTFSVASYVASTRRLTNS